MARKKAPEVRTSKGNKVPAYKSEAHRLAHPFQDATSDWLRNNEAALVELREQQAEHARESRKLSLKYAELWLSYCQDNDAPKAVQKQAAIRVAVTERRVNDN
jgi:hypothetical protein